MEKKPKSLAETAEAILGKVRPFESDLDRRDAWESYDEDGIGAVLVIALCRERITPREARILWNWSCRQTDAEGRILDPDAIFYGVRLDDGREIEVCVKSDDVDFL